MLAHTLTTSAIWLRVMSNQHHYVVTWIIDEYADSPEDAAKQALARMRDHDSVCTVFDVMRNDNGEKVTVDLDPDAV